MASRQDAKFKSYDGLTLRGWFYRAGENRPCIILTHGLAGLKEQYLPDFAERFQAAGYGALIYDNRNYGSSDGQPRNHTDPFLQHRDYSAAFDFVASLPDVDPTNIIFWGSSLSGGNATQAAAIDIRVRSVILQCPFVSSERVREELGNTLKNAFSDRASSIAGKEPTMIPVNPYSGKGSKGDKERAVLTDPDIHSYHAELDRRGIPHGLSITLQSLIAISGFEPGALIDRISPKPLLMIIGEMEKTIPIDLQLRTFEKAREPKQLHIVKGQGHFGLYHGEGFQENVQVQLDWLKRIL
ncbi:Alpha/Beta hydrolase protein [Bisporella sp. PMI_857]|nr:Alpha/Beta hydrolase protein [Bisporella sp. PMI_857]